MSIPEPTQIHSDGPAPRVPEFRRDRSHAQPVEAARVLPVPPHTISLNQVAAVAIWLIACTTTWQFILALGAMNQYQAIVAAVVAQALLTVVERPFWTKRRDAVAGAAVLVDMLINAGGMWPWMSRLDQTPPWRMLAEALQLAPGLAIVPALVLSLAMGYVLAAAPERVFSRR